MTVLLTPVNRCPLRQNLRQPLSRRLGRGWEDFGRAAGLDRSPIAEADLARAPGAAGRPASQRRNLQLDLIAGLERLAAPAVANEAARAQAFEAPGLGAAVVLLDGEEDEGVRVGKLELLNNTLQLDLIILVEHGIG